MRLWVFFVVLAASNFTWSAEAVTASESPGRITGIGGIFVVSKNPKALAAWYRDVLGMHLHRKAKGNFRAATCGSVD